MRRTLTFACVIAVAGTGLGACGPKAEPVAPAATVMPMGVSITSPTSGATVGSPVTVTGSAPRDWYSEAQFEAELLAADGTVLAQAPARAQDEDATSRDSVRFTASLTYVSPAAQAGTIVLTEDQTGEDLPPPRTVRVPVKLSPAT